MRSLRPTVSALTVADRLAKHLGLIRMMRRRSVGGVTILMYHKVLPRDLADAYPWRNLVVDAPAFDIQMGWLAKNYEVLTVREAVAVLDGNGNHGYRRPLLCVTFDDGYHDNYEYAAPILESHGLRGTFFVTTGFVEGCPLWFDRAAAVWLHDPVAAVAAAVNVRDLHPELRKSLSDSSTLQLWMRALKTSSETQRNAILEAIPAPAIQLDEVYDPMKPEQIRQMADNGHEIGAHSVTHPILVSLDDQSLSNEMKESRAALAAWTGSEIEGFCYPNGDYDNRVVEAANAAGYSYACSVQRGVATMGSERMALPRRAISMSHKAEGISEFEAEVVGWHDWLRDTRRWLSRNKTGQ